MASSSSAPSKSLFITAEATESMESNKIDLYNTLSQVPQGVLIKGDLSNYIDCKIEDLGPLAIYSQLKSLCDKNRKIKPNYIRVYEKCFHNAGYFLENFEEEHVRIILIHVHGGNMYLDRSHTITKEAIHVVTGFWQIGEVPKLRKISQNTIIELTKTTCDSRAMSVNNIQDEVVRYATMIIGYRIFHSSRMNSVPSAAVQATYQMIKENVDYDLCEAMQSQLMLNLESIKDNSQKFTFGQLLISLFFYFKNFIPGIGDIQWSNDTPLSA